MKVLVLGGNGFIGLHLVKALVRKGHQVRVFDKKQLQVTTHPDSVETVLGDFTDKFSVAEALSGIDIVYHLISTTVPGTSNLDMPKDIESNLIPSVNLMNTMINTGIKKIVFLSSGGTVYGEPENIPISESHKLAPICSYGVVKVAIENYLHLFSKLNGIEYNILRVSNPYGAFQQHFGVQGVISTIIDKVLHKEPITIWGDGNIKRDFIYIDDLVNVMIPAAEKLHNDVFNIGSGVSTSINEIIAEVERSLSKKANIHYKPGRPFDISKISLDCGKAMNIFEWSPVYDLPLGIKNVCEWARNYN